jgi:hypothetical protein
MANLANINNNIITDSGISSSSYVSGTSGTSGNNGISGNTGTAGTSGSSGLSTVSGTSGSSGLSRTSGANGATGSSGTSGSSGVSGVSTTSGSSGTSGVSGQSIAGSSGTSGTSTNNPFGAVSYSFPYYTSSNIVVPTNWRASNSNISNILVGSGTTNYTSGALAVGGNVKFANTFNCLNAYQSPISGRNVYITNPGGILGYNASTRESKTNISTLENILWLNDLRPVSFNYKKRDENNNIIEGELEEETKYGFIAEEVDLVNPELTYYVNGEIESIRHDQLIIPVLAKIQDLQRRIKLLKEKKGLI